MEQVQTEIKYITSVPLLSENYLYVIFFAIMREAPKEM